MTDKTKEIIKKVAEKLLYVIIGAALSAGIINSDKLLDLMTKNEKTQTTTAVESYSTDATEVVEVKEVKAE
jgi:uncharacterized protein YhfF